MTYLMESAQEVHRLQAQASAASYADRLRLTGLRPGDAALDVGCGPGVITSEMLDVVGPQGRVVGIEPQAEHLAAARGLLAGRPNVELCQGALPDTRLPADHFDYVWCQYVFEYLGEPGPALAELVRVVRPGGRVVVADIDGVGLWNWPFPEDLQAESQKLLAALRAARFDLHAGRKLFHLFRKAGLADVRVHISPFYVAAGAVDARLHEDWVIRFRTLRPLAEPFFGGAGPYDAFCERFLALLDDADTLKYAMVLTTEGVKR
ncbi:methyltransferase domain-containing protein [Myxococcus sp. SDU36]|uniref:methyltransferase domain-containing protein n=1 Tax=Myxococcus sp. SDU36 TaxID=2831967 RepID=UPI002543DBEA|nr:methyltransferase domain-containing protein [Myxococcus sp. SDU36]WIG96272.1 methyltransferase domain-containing protein [Myxococcus sp. SDU36]